MPLDRLLAALYAVADEGERFSPQQERAAFRERALARRPAGYGRDDPLEITERLIPGPAGPVPVRIYRLSTPQALAPTVVYFHGGGWVIGDLDTHDHNARAISLTAGAVVVSVDYRLAPEHRYPAALDDCFAATSWARDHADALGGSASIALAGDSAGGGLAAGVALRFAATGRARLAAQLLLYPALDLTLHTPSVSENAVGYGLRADDMRWFASHYAPDPDVRADGLASPLLAADVSGSPPTVVATAMFDPLRDEGDRYAARLRDAGVVVHHRCYPTLAHSFMNLDVLAAVPAAQAAADESLALFAALLR